MIIATNPNASNAICKVSPMWNEFDFFIAKCFLGVQFNSAFQESRKGGFPRRRIGAIV